MKIIIDLWILNENKLRYFFNKNLIIKFCNIFIKIDFIKWRIIYKNKSALLIRIIKKLKFNN